MFRCPVCGTLHTTQLERKKCCDQEDKRMIIPQNLTKQEFTQALIQTEQSMGQHRMTKQLFQGKISPQQLAQFLWKNLSGKKEGMSEEQMFKIIRLHCREVIMTSLVNKKFMEPRGVDQKGQICYKLTDLGKTAGDILGWKN